MHFVIVFLLVLGLYQEEQPAAPVAEPVKPVVVQVFPVIPSTNTPKEPTPIPAPPSPTVNEVPVLIPGRLFIVKSDVKFSLVISDDSLIQKPRKVKGPRDISGVFADGDGTDEDRTIDSPYLAIIKAKEGKTGRVKITYIPKGADEEDKFLEILIDVGQAPRPPPKPDEPPKPDDPVKPPVEPEVGAFKTLVKSITAIHPELPAADKPKIAAAFREAAVQIEQGKITEPGMQLTKVTADLMMQKLGGVQGMLSIVPWRDDVTRALKTQNYATIKDHIKPWNDIADVLEGR